MKLSPDGVWDRDGQLDDDECFAKLIEEVGEVGIAMKYRARGQTDNLTEELNHVIAVALRWLRELQNSSRGSD